MRLCLSAVLLCLIAMAARADITLVGVGTIRGDASDLSGLKGKAPDGTPNNRLGGLGSAIAYTGTGNEYILASDRGPKDGAGDFACRVHRMTIRVDLRAKQPVALELQATILLADEHGRTFTGALDGFLHAGPEKNRRLDPEGIRVGRDGALFVSDEYGPVVYEFDAKGRRVRSLPVPDHFHVAKPGKTPADELPPKATAGRQPNRGMEGLAISPDGARLYGAMQSPLIQDGALDKKNAHVGVNCRLLEIDLRTSKTREFVYRLDNAANGVCEILAVNDREFLVLERDGKGGKDAACKKIFRIDLAGATDVSGVKSLPADGLPKRIKPVKKSLFLDLLDKRFGIAGAGCPEKFEGLSFGPDLGPDRRLLLVSADNDYVADKPFRVYAFEVGEADIKGFRPQKFQPKR